MEQVYQPTFIEILSVRSAILEKVFEEISSSYSSLVSQGVPFHLLRFKHAAFIRAFNRYDQAVCLLMDCWTKH